MPLKSREEIRLRYRLLGQGPPLVVLMSPPINSAWLCRQTQYLASHFQMILVENHPHGKNGQPGRTCSIAGMAGDTVGLMDELGLTSAHVLGISIGGCIAQEMALGFPQRVRGLILACTTCGGNEAPTTPEHLMRRCEHPGDMAHGEVLPRNLHLYFSDRFLSEDGPEVERFIQLAMADQQQAMAFNWQLEALRGFASARRLPGLIQPTLITTGSDDCFMPPENSMILARLIPDSSLMVFPRGRHGFYIEMADRFNREAASFLHQVDRA